MIIGNGRLVTNDPENPYFENGAVRIDGDVIQAVGTFEELKAAYPDDEILDAQGRVIMPGMINAHTHNDRLPLVFLLFHIFYLPMTDDDNFQKYCMLRINPPDAHSIRNF